jgi:23S rRNA (uridine2552-2'-O)-methyltransferase
MMRGADARAGVAAGAEPQKAGTMASRSRPPGQGAASPGGRRDLSVRVKTAKGRKLSSTRWLQRQLNDPFVAAAKREGYRSRAAFKLSEIDDKYKIIKAGDNVLDLGAAPGGWSQVAARKVGPAGRVIALDLKPVDDLAGVEFLLCDFLEPEAPQRILAALGGARLQVVLSDLAPSTSGHRGTDHLRIMALAEAALDLARQVLAPGGTFLAKVFQGGSQGDMLSLMKREFASVRHVKPEASRPESAELYVLAMGFRGNNTT